MNFKRYLMIGIVTASLVVTSYLPAFANHAQTEVITNVENVFEVATLNHSRLLDEYRLAKYDVINVMVVGFPDGIGVNDIMVGPDGYVQLPYAGLIKLAGLTIPEATEAIQERLGEYIRIPSMSVLIKSYGVRKVNVVGEVNKPGVQELPIDSMDVFAAISSAEGVAERGRSKHVQIIRVIDDKMYVKEVNLDAYMKKHDISQNIRLIDGDMVYVPSSNKIIFKDDILPYISVYSTYKALTK